MRRQLATRTAAGMLAAMTTKADTTAPADSKTRASSPPNGAEQAPLAAAEASLEDQACVYTMTQEQLQQWSAARQHAERVGQQHSREARQLMVAEAELERAKLRVDAAREANQRAAEKAVEADQAWERLTQEILGDHHKAGAKLSITDDGKIIDQVALMKLRQSAKN